MVRLEVVVHFVWNLTSPKSSKAFLLSSATSWVDGSVSACQSPEPSPVAATTAFCFESSQFEKRSNFHFSASFFTHPSISVCTCVQTGELSTQIILANESTERLQSRCSELDHLYVIQLSSIFLIPFWSKARFAINVPLTVCSNLKPIVASKLIRFLTGQINASRLQNHIRYVSSRVDYFVGCDID